jgi:uncharacterized membrane protein YphA (DoxX/SURF4 family)
MSSKPQSATGPGINAIRSLFGGSEPLTPMGWTLLAIRVLFAGVFIWTSVWHSTHSKEFLESIEAYQIISGPIVPWSGLFFIILEASIGVTLVFGYFVRQMAFAAAALLAVFTGVFVSAIARKLDIACGCGLGNTKVGWLDVVRDVLLMAIALLIAWRTGKKEEEVSTEQAAEQLSAAK